MAKMWDHATLSSTFRLLVIWKNYNIKITYPSKFRHFSDLAIPRLGRGLRVAFVLSDEAERRDAGVGEHACDPFDLTRDAEHKPGGAAVRLRPDG